MGPYRYLIGDLAPTGGGNGIRAELPLSTVKYTHRLNGVGGLTASMGLRHPKARRADIDPGRTALHIERHGVIVWSGILWAARAEVESATLSVVAQDWWSYFRGPASARGRTVRSTRTFAGVDQLEIARTLIQAAQSETGGDLGIVTGTETCGVTRDRTYQAHERKNVGEAIEQLAAVADGFDFGIDVTYEAGLITKRFRPAYPRRGSATPLRWELGVNLEAFGQEVDGTRFASRFDAFGAGDGPGMLIATAVDPDALTAGYPLMDGQVTYKDVTVPDTLEGHALSALAQASQPIDTLNVSVSPTDPNTALGAWITGDTVTVAGTDGWITVPPRPMRIMGYEVTVDEEGGDTIKVAIADEEATST